MNFAITSIMISVSMIEIRINYIYFQYLYYCSFLLTKLPHENANSLLTKMLQYKSENVR